MKESTTAATTQAKDAMKDAVHDAATTKVADMTATMPCHQALSGKQALKVPHALF